MMLLKKIHHSVNSNFNKLKNKINEIEELNKKVNDLEKRLCEKENQILELTKYKEKSNKELNIVANDVYILANFAKELYALWEENGFDEFDLFDLKRQKDKKKNNYH